MSEDGAEQRPQGQSSALWSLAAATLLHQEHPRKGTGPAQEIGTLSAGGKSLCRSKKRCKFFSLTETPEDYTIIVDEEGFLDCKHQVTVNLWSPAKVTVSSSLATRGLESKTDLAFFPFEGFLFSIWYDLQDEQVEAKPQWCFWLRNWPFQPSFGLFLVLLEDLEKLQKWLWG
ncbi:hypothetical protein DUI87_12592 [Hirundo rustica rustica]|uniref:CASTOR1 N-terminal domain-containing protein n=1 Tax=Hirundo rustica rustica TaxID=333673 RepID=A0A3M0KCD9_HIRRU|nr:hypothetical protein DUI87_12592 [Hirundo rustica rustica]